MFYLFCVNSKKYPSALLVVHLSAHFHAVFLLYFISVSFLKQLLQNILTLRIEIIHLVRMLKFLKNYKS